MWAIANSAERRSSESDIATGVCAQVPAKPKQAQSRLNRLEASGFRICGRSTRDDATPPILGPGPCQPHKNVLQIRLASGDVFDGEALFLQDGEHLARAQLILIIGDLDPARPVQFNLVEGDMLGCGFWILLSNLLIR